MAGNISPTDMKTISNGILDGLGTVDQLPSNVKNQLMQYWGSQGVDVNNMGSDVTQAQLQQLQKQRQDQESGLTSFFNSPVFKPVEWVGSKLYQAYSATVSPVLSTAFMDVHDLIYGTPEWSKGQSELDELGNVWDYSHNISPGQAIWMLGLNNDELKARGLDWKQIADDTAAQKAGTFHGTPSVNDPFGTMTRAQEYFSNGTQKYVTGTTDFALSWYADPTVLAGKGLGAAKEISFTKAVQPEIEKLSGIATRAEPTLTPDEANKLAWNSFTNKSPFQGLTDSIWNIKQANPDTATAVINRSIPTMSKSANGPAVASLLGQATTKPEVANILRISMGDDVANQALKFQNDEIAYQVNQLTASHSSVSTYYDGLSPTEQMSPWGQRMKATLDDQSKQLADLDQSRRIVSDKLDAFGTLGALNYNRFTTPIGIKAREAYQASAGFRPISNDQAGFIGAAVNNIYSLSLGGIVRLAHAYGDIKPSHYIDVNDKESYRQLDASLGQVKGLSQEDRDMYVSRYMNAGPQDKTVILGQIEQQVARNLVDRYNDSKGLTGTADEITPEVADQLYKEIASRRSAAQANMNSQSFGGATIDDPNHPGLQIRVDEIEGDGGKVVTSPLLKSQMANSHVMMDFDLYQKAIKSNGSFWQKAASQLGNTWHTTVGLGDYVNSVWKFGQLFRLGYSPRMLAADDAMSQLARFGPVAMFSRGIAGGKYTWQALRRATTPEGSLEAALVSRGNLEMHINDLEASQKDLQSQIAKAKLENRTYDLPSLQSQLDGNVEDLNTARQNHADMDALVKGGQGMAHQQVGRQVFTPAFGGAQGSLFRDLNAGEANFKNMMGSSADSYLNRLRRMDWTLLSPAKNGEGVHMDAWLRVINQQVANDDLAVNYLKGKTQAQLVNWLSTPEGLAYKSDNALSKHLPNDQVVKRVAAQVDEWLNPAFPGGDAIRQAATRGEVTKDMLKEVPEAVRPLVNGQALSYARGNHSAMALLDRAMDGYYKYAAQLPGQFLLRNPLFAQRYGVHLQDIMSTMGKSGDELITDDLRRQVENAARVRALNDVKKNTFTMDYETKMSHALRQMGSFFGAQQESWNRWARIISDKPDILPRIAQIYGAPARAGLEVDQNGMPVDGEGYSRDPVTGERRLVPFSERQITIQIPDYLGGKQFKKFFGLDPNAVATIPMNTFVMVLSHGDGPNPVGAGPIVQIAANQIPFTGLDANDNPDMADLYKRLGILPFGPQKMDLGSAVQTFLPTWARKALSEQGGMSDTYANQMWNIMQAENYKYSMGMRKDAPTWGEISDRAHTQTWLKVLSGFTLPFSAQTQDPYQFFRDQYKQMQQRDPQNADQTFYDKYGDSAYIFARSLSKNNTGLQATTESIKASKYYQDLIAKVGPEWAGLIVGAEGDGVYSNGAFFYQKTHAAEPGSTTPMRTTMSPREALDASNTARGWMQYKSYMNGLYAQLFQRGLKTFNDGGAEDLLQQKQSLIKVLTSPRLPANVLQNLQAQEAGQQGTLAAASPMVDNPFYNASWTKAFSTQDKSQYDRTAAALRQVVNDPEIWSKAVNPDGSVGMRSDIYTLKTYLGYRDDLQRALILRKENGGTDNITAASNGDLKYQWDALVTTLIEQDTQFGDLFHRHLSKDMGYNEQTAAMDQQQGQLGTFTGSTEGYQSQNIFDQLAGG